MRLLQKLDVAVSSRSNGSAASTCGRECERTTHDRLNCSVAPAGVSLDAERDWWS